ncbi:MAG: DUF305 domain-containing protein [Pseudanabaena sp. M57BS1SP1A06MG]|nr:DUF305 domain-containing protein [Pseudanabaena sp. M53BS1SP1A06MG]MCA6592847.1 DUF305 domain-containing protein [Pseudanabaena sp. M38BS1SP1A06MG]MCA6601826.1 DUF305 domain-containing protein [Pseudanabaena sp. M57BS1SP1A06MG]
MNFSKLNILFHSLGLVSIASISTFILAACTTTNPETSASNSPVAVTPSSTPSTPSTMHNMNNMHMGNMAMDLGPADANFDLRFIDGMIPHHQGAVAMAKEAQQKSERPEIKKLADEIIKAQTKEIAELQTWRKQWYASAGNKPMAYDAKMGRMMEMSQDQMSGMMMSQDLGAKDADFDLRFINAMIPHHEGAVTMAQNAATKSTRPEIKKLAQDIISSQQAEIKQMQQWKQDWYKK